MTGLPRPSAGGHERLARTSALIEQGMTDGLHVGAQLALRIGDVAIDAAWGIARTSVPMDADSMMIWFSSTKPVTAVSVAQQWERGTLGLDDHVVEHVPEFAGGGKEAITIRHLLTHTAGIRFADTPGGVRGAGGMGGTWDERTARICGASVEPGWVPGQKAGYHPTSGMHMLAEVVRRIDGRPFPQYVRDEVFLPLAMQDCWIGMPPEAYDSYGDRIGSMHNTSGAAPTPLPAMDSRAAVASSVPGAGGRGPMRELVRLYQMFVGGGALDGVSILGPQTVEAMTARHRTGMRDETFGAVIDWGLGVIIETWNYGHHSSRRTFGHGGAQSSVGFADPEHGLAAAMVFNGMAGPGGHSARQAAVSTALYEDLGLGTTGRPSNEKPMFQDGFAAGGPQGERS